jgi:hypothetical protein
MQIYVTLQLAAVDDITMTLAEAAVAVLAALGGDPATDTCIVNASVPAGVAGVDPSPPVPPAIQS